MKNNHLPTYAQTQSVRLMDQEPQLELRNINHDFNVLHLSLDIYKPNQCILMDKRI